MNSIDGGGDYGGLARKNHYSIGIYAWLNALGFECFFPFPSNLPFMHFQSICIKRKLPEKKKKKIFL